MSNETLTAEALDSIPQADLAQFLACETPNLGALTADAPINGERVA